MFTYFNTMLSDRMEDNSVSEVKQYHIWGFLHSGKWKIFFVTLQCNLFGQDQ